MIYKKQERPMCGCGNTQDPNGYMKFRFLTIVLFVFLTTSSYTQQLKLEKHPEENQLFARDTNDNASVVFSGTIIENNYNEFTEFKSI